MSDGKLTGDEPLADGMRVFVRLRRDCTVTDADRLLATACRIYREQNPDATDADAAAFVTGAADPLCTVLEAAGRE
ncbi:hypothetical protein [Catenuloplanes indicus]|uniref:Uncharacterized protein n=1 Tax=Catenuloplanes indicus TaxID=137267 RepID=A0AAE3W7A8_9ACTN|nr:hypothetical protein [Catenuloplanes indicus]MDQ0370869.1 hypothetical protein [Catenuloplanes indicus]